MHNKSEKIVFLGEQGCGKTKLLSSMQNISSKQNIEWNNDYKPTEGICFTRIKYQSSEWVGWEASGLIIDSESQCRLALLGASKVVIAVDLSKPAPFENIQAYLNAVAKDLGHDFKRCILVGCKADEANEKGLEDFYDYQLPPCFCLKRYLTSAKTSEGIEAFLSELDDNVVANPRDDITKAAFLKATDNFLNEAKKLPDEKYGKLFKLTNDLKLCVDNKNFTANLRNTMVKQYKKKCQKIIGGQYLPTLKLLAVVVITALAAILAGSIGFGIGFMVGFWTGPGAFLTALMGGNAFAVAATAFTAVTTATALGVSAGGMFCCKSNPLETKLDEVYIEARQVVSGIK